MSDDVRSVVKRGKHQKNGAAKSVVTKGKQRKNGAALTVRSLVRTCAR
ncbi:hypothetical protein PI125_g23621 [Phytophthora idaei]|nr:hypothetical protein PI125_g23621 [Phytophthora idaei]KAG3123817.1 hypothetical protein PI126_g23536 [Phytophthora idaei]